MTTQIYSDAELDTFAYKSAFDGYRRAAAGSAPDRTAPYRSAESAAR